MLNDLKVLLMGQSGPNEGSLRAQLDSLDYHVLTASALDDACRVVAADNPDLIIINAAGHNMDLYVVLSQIREMTENDRVPIMLGCLPGDYRTEVDGLDLGVDDCFELPIDTGVLAARIRILLRNRYLEQSLRRQNEERERINRELITARENLRRELQLASRIQRSLLPERMPPLGNFQFAGTLMSSGAVSGDFYDVYRLDETHYGFYVADAIGHGVPAALLTIFVKKGIQTRDITPDGYRLLPPGEVLGRLNRDIMEASLSDNPFVTLFYTILDVESARLTYASGGHPGAVLLHADGSHEMLETNGALLGIFDSEFSDSAASMGPGDTVFLYSDGIEDARAKTGATGIQALVEHFAARLPKTCDVDFADCVKGALHHLFDVEKPLRDDVTVLGLRRLD